MHETSVYFSRKAFFTIVAKLKNWVVRAFSVFVQYILRLVGKGHLSLQSKVNILKSWGFQIVTEDFRGFSNIQEGAWRFLHVLNRSKEFFFLFNNNPFPNTSQNVLIFYSILGGFMKVFSKGNHPLIFHKKVWHLKKSLFRTFWVKS